MSDPIPGGGERGSPERTAECGAILLFDGVCNLCNGAVRFVVERDPEAYFAFAALQSDAGRRLLSRHGLPEDELSSVILIEDGRVHVRSDAALRVARHLSGAWPLLSAFRWVPRPIRDGVYDLIASHRYRWFGRRDACAVPTPELRERFLS